MHLGYIAEVIEGELIGDPNCVVSGIGGIHDDCEDKLSFILEKKYESIALDSNASAFVTHRKLPNLKNQIVVRHARKALAKTIELFYPDIHHTEFTPGISHAASVDKTAVIDSSSCIQAFVSIGSNSVIGAQTLIMPNVTIGANCKIGTHCVLYPGVVIYDHCEIGDHVRIHAGTRIGIDGYGYYPEKGNLIKIPHIGKVIIQNHVEIGGNACIDRGCLRDTIIGEGTKIDNLSHIAHNVIIGKHCAITGHVAFMGGASLGDHVQIGGQTGIANVHIGSDSVVAARSGVTKDIPNGSFVSGFPAWEHGLELKKESMVRKMVTDQLKNRKGDHHV